MGINCYQQGFVGNWWADVSPPPCLWETGKEGRVCAEVFLTAYISKSPNQSIRRLHPACVRLSGTQFNKGADIVRGSGCPRAEDVSWLRNSPEDQHEFRPNHRHTKSVFLSFVCCELWFPVKKTLRCQMGTTKHRGSRAGEKRWSQPMVELWGFFFKRRALLQSQGPHGPAWGSTGRIVQN